MNRTILHLLLCSLLANGAMASVGASSSLADTRSVATGLESYFVDYNAYPHRYQITGGTLLAHHYNYSGPVNEAVPLTSPTAYLASARSIDDPFFSTPSSCVVAIPGCRAAALRAAPTRCWNSLPSAHLAMATFASLSSPGASHAAA